MDGNELIIKYNIGWNGKPYSTNDPHPTGTMRIHLDKAFQTKKTKADVEKCVELVHRRKLMKFIIQAGSEENIDHLQSWLKQNSKLWLQEFEKLLNGKVVI
jgi:hypothetical protein